MRFANWRRRRYERSVAAGGAAALALLPAPPRTLSCSLLFCGKLEQSSRRTCTARQSRATLTSSDRSSLRASRVTSRGVVRGKWRRRESMLLSLRKEQLELSLGRTHPLVKRRRPQRGGGAPPAPPCPRRSPSAPASTARRLIRARRPPRPTARAKRRRHSSPPHPALLPPPWSCRPLARRSRRCGGPSSASPSSGPRTPSRPSSPSSAPPPSSTSSSSR